MSLGEEISTADYPPSPWDGLRRGERGSDGYYEKVFIRGIRVIRGLKNERDDAMNQFPIGSVLMSQR